jgi:hypothetical protein
LILKIFHVLAGENHFALRTIAVNDRLC